MIKQEQRVISPQEADWRFQELRLVPDVNVSHAHQITPAWLEGYRQQCDRQIAIARRENPREGKAVEAMLRERQRHVAHLCDIIFAARKEAAR